jgi:hypothetical protein
VSRRSLTIEQVLTLLAETPPRVAELTAGLAPDQLHAAPNPDEWSANDVLAHLRACADVWGNCIVTKMVQDAPTLRAVNPRTWIKKTNYLEQDFQPSLPNESTHRARWGITYLAALCTPFSLTALPLLTSHRSTPNIAVLTCRASS